MKKFVPVIALLAGLISAQGALSATSAPTDAELRACFQAHAALMEKPGLKNPIACWRAHGYLMRRT